jgi:LCP family protein required for cell wall assembly
VADGRDRAPRRGATAVSGESVEDILARHGLADSSGAQPTGGRAARRRAAEERERAERNAGPNGTWNPDTGGQNGSAPRRGGHAMETGAQPARGGHALETGAAPAYGRGGPETPGRHGSPSGQPETGGRRRRSTDDPTTQRSNGGPTPWSGSGGPAPAPGNGAHDPTTRRGGGSGPWPSGGANGSAPPRPNGADPAARPTNGASDPAPWQNGTAAASDQTAMRRGNGGPTPWSGRGAAPGTNGAGADDPAARSGANGGPGPQPNGSTAWPNAGIGVGGSGANGAAAGRTPWPGANGVGPRPGLDAAPGAASGPTRRPGADPARGRHGAGPGPGAERAVDPAAYGGAPRPTDRFFPGAPGSPGGPQPHPGGAHSPRPQPGPATGSGTDRSPAGPDGDARFPGGPTAYAGAPDGGAVPPGTEHPSFPGTRAARPAPTEHPSFPPQAAPQRGGVEHPSFPTQVAPRVPRPNGSPLSPPHGGPQVPGGETTALRPPAVANAAAMTTAVPTAYRGPVDNAAAATTALPTRGKKAAPDATVAVSQKATAAQKAADLEETRLTRREAERKEAVSRIDESLVRMTAAHAGLELESSKVDVEEEAPPAPRRRRLGRFAVKLVAATLTLLVLGGAGLGYGTKRWLGSGIRDAGAVDLTSSAIVDAAAQKGDQNVLVVAADQSRDPAARADTVVVAHIPAGGGRVTVLSLPHNLQINRPSCDTWDAAAATYSDDPRPAAADTQLVTALDEGGPRCVTKVVQQVTGLAITQYVGLDLGSVEGLSSALQGIDVCVPTPVVDTTLGTIVPTAGTSRLDGVHAADFARALAVQGDPASELGRIDRQQRLLAAVLDRTLDERSLLDVGAVTKLRPALHDALLLDGDDLDQTLALADALRKIGTPGVAFAAAPTTGGTDGTGNAVLRDADAAAVFSALRADRPLPDQAGDPTAATAGPDPAQVRVQVSNASAKPGRAEQVSGTLGTLGFGLGDVGNAAIATNDTIIKFSPDQAAAAALLASSVPSATSVPDPGSTGVLQLVLGRSFDDVIKPPAAAAPGAATPAPDGPRANCP